MAEEMNRKDAAQEKLTDRNYVYVRYENDDDDEMDIYDIITLCKKGLLIAKRYIALLLVFFVLGGVVGFVKAKVFKEEKYTSTALLFVDLNRDVIDTSNDMNESSKISMLANSFSQIVSSDSVIAPIAKQYALDSEDIDVQSAARASARPSWIPASRRWTALPTTPPSASFPRPARAKRRRARPQVRQLPPSRWPPSSWSLRF